MRRNYSRLILSILAVVLSGIFAFAQEAEYKDVILDGKPAKLNVATGEVTLVNPNDKKKIRIRKGSLTTIEKDTLNVEATPNYHIVKEGETLLDLSKRYKQSLTDLKKANNLETTLLYIGQRVQVGNLDEVQIVKQPTEELEEPAQPTVSSDFSDFHIVEKGNTLYSLAKRYGFSVSELKQQNGLRSNLIKVGQKLRVSNFTEVKITDDSIWTVSKGDTLYNIAKRNNTSVDVLKKLNDLTSNLIKIGQKLRLK